MSCAEPTPVEDLRTLQDYHTLEALWTHLLHETDTSPTIHPPPGLRRVIESVTSRMYDYLVERIDHSDEEVTLQDTVMGTLQIAYKMYQFGQLCERVGVSAETLLQCDCGSLDEETIKRLLEGN